MVRVTDGCYVCINRCDESVVCWGVGRTECGWFKWMFGYSVWHRLLSWAVLYLVSAMGCLLWLLMVYYLGAGGGDWTGLSWGFNGMEMGAVLVRIEHSHDESLLYGALLTTVNGNGLLLTLYFLLNTQGSRYKTNELPQYFLSFWVFGQVLRGAWELRWRLPVSRCWFDNLFLLPCHINSPFMLGCTHWLVVALFTLDRCSKPLPVYVGWCPNVLLYYLFLLLKS